MGPDRTRSWKVRSWKVRTASAAGCALTLLALSACSPDEGLRVERDGSRPVASASAQPHTEPVDAPFSAEQIRKAALADASMAADAEHAQVLETLLYCTDCLELTEPLIIGETKHQIAMVSTPREHRKFAGLVVSDDKGTPVIDLVVSGTDLTLTPGQGGTLVAQETLYRTGDPRCCPSGWSVRVFRSHEGRFEAGQRISRDGGD